MNTLIRWGKFNLVGAIGMGLQLTVLAVLNRWTNGHYLVASVAAIELTLLHNFAWHWQYTWRDRRDDSAVLSRLMKFHLSNGLISMLGNLVVMQVLVHEMHVSVLPANCVAILICSILNFWLGNDWAFAGNPSQTARSF